MTYNEHRSPVCVLGLGGTIAMAATAGTGATPTHDVHAIVKAADVDRSFPMVRARQVVNMPGAHLGYDAVLECLGVAEAEVEAGAAGAVVLMGTDTLEEVAFLLHLLWSREEPLVITGAMRHQGMPSADGNSNLLDAIRVASAQVTRGCGAMVVANGQIHSAAWARKMHTHLLQAISSPVTGPLGEVIEDEVALFRPAMPGRPVLDTPVLGLEVPYVPILEMGFADDGQLISHAVASGARGLVLAATGAGHVSVSAAVRAAQAATQIPVVLASRVAAGPVLTRTYGFPGSEQDLLRKGLIHAGFLDPPKARILLTVALMTASEQVVSGLFREINERMVSRSTTALRVTP